MSFLNENGLTLLVSKIKSWVESKGYLTSHQDISGKVDKTDPRLSDARTPIAHTHDDRYYTEGEVNNIVNGKNGSNIAVGGAGAYNNWQVAGAINDLSGRITNAGGIKTEVGDFVANGTKTITCNSLSRIDILAVGLHYDFGYINPIVVSFGGISPVRENYNDRGGSLNALSGNTFTWTWGNESPWYYVAIQIGN